MNMDEQNRKYRPDEEKHPVTGNLQKDSAVLFDLFEGCSDLKYNEIHLGTEHNISCIVAFIETTVENMLLDETVLGKMLTILCTMKKEEVYTSLEQNSFGVSDMAYFETIEDAINGMLSGAALLGAPLGHDFTVISLSDLLTPWELIERRLAAAAEGDFAICLYNPSSHKRHDYLQKACQILLQKKSGDTMKKGDILLEFDIDKIKADGYDVTTPIIISNTEQFAKVKACEDKVVTKESKLLSVQ